MTTRRLALAAIAGLLLCGAPRAIASPPTNSRDDLICRAKSAVGYSYHWGGSCWCHTGCSPNFGACSAGSCSGSCPSCTHYGTYGADCSGLVNKVWQVPDPIATTTCGHGPYVANSFTSSGAYWNSISRSSILRGDVLASSTHVLVYESGDPWGSFWAYEAKGCSYGVVHNVRTCSSSYSAARRINISSCQCTAGQVETAACGNCGTKKRTCGSDCQWGAWSSCTGQGVCSPGSTQSSACCDCGSQSRTCNNSCQWGGWSTCDGPDPDGGNQQCDTGESGPCAEGRMRCESGCLTCRRSYQPQPETCDGIDNDCSGAIDDGNPTTMGATPPAYAAALQDFSFPSNLAAGATAEVWAKFQNVGSETWQPGEIWLASVAANQGGQSQLFPDGDWPAWNVAAIIDEAVAPGETGFVSFPIAAAADPEPAIHEGFRLQQAGGAMMACPSPEIEIATTTRGHDDPGDDEDQPHAMPLTSGCTIGDHRAPASLPLLLLAIAWAIRRRRPVRRIE